jgi:hypothetical protein
MAQFQIGRSAGVCAATGRRFLPGEAVVTVLLEVEGTEELQRLEYSCQAWDAGGGGARPQGGARVFGSWRGRAPDPDAKRRGVIDDQAVLELFEQLEGQAEERRVAVRYVLGLLLVRKRLMVLEASRPGMMLLRRKGEDEGEAIEVVDPGLSDEAVEGVVEQLKGLLGGAE